MRSKSVLGLLCAASISVGMAGAAYGQQTVKIGAIFPLSGNAASAGVHAKAAIETAVEIINNGHPGLGKLPTTKGPGLQGLGGAKVEVVFADNQGSPAVGQNQALRLITEEKVVALTGAYQSGITLTASAIAEKYGIPYVNGELVAASLTERGFKWFFRVTPVAGDFAKIYLDFLKDMKAAGAKIDNIALVHENTEYGTSVSNVITSTFKENGLSIAQDISYSANTTDLQSQVLQLKDKKPDVVIMISYTSDAILYAKTFQALDYKPAMLIADNAGFSDPSTLKTVGKQIKGIFNRSSFAIGVAGTPTFLINEMYKKKSGGDDMDDTAARQMQADASPLFLSGLTVQVWSCWSLRSFWSFSHSSRPGGRRIRRPPRRGRSSHPCRDRRRPGCPVRRRPPRRPPAPSPEPSPAFSIVRTEPTTPQSRQSGLAGGADATCTGGGGSACSTTFGFRTGGNRNFVFRRGNLFGRRLWLGNGYRRFPCFCDLVDFRRFCLGRLWRFRHDWRGSLLAVGTGNPAHDRGDTRCAEQGDRNGRDDQYRVGGAAGSLCVHVFLLRGHIGGRPQS